MLSVAVSKPGLRGVLGVLAGIAILALVNASILGKEKLLSGGQAVYLELAPVDPRSLMQGDYMALNFEVAGKALAAMPHETQEEGGFPELPPQDGRIVVTLDERAVARFARIDDASALAANEIYMKYRVRNGQLKFATNAYFFQEGTADLYANARFGKFRVDPGGELLLTALADEQLKVLGPEF